MPLTYLHILLSDHMCDCSSEEYQSSTVAAGINLAKLCIGTGILALPYATLHGGLIFSPIGIALIALWNGIACTMLMRCKRAFKHNESLQKSTQHLSSPYSRIAYAATGSLGVYTIDFSIIITLLGVCVTYQIAFASLVSDIPGSIFSIKILTIISGLCVYPISCAKNVGILAQYSLFGLVFLLIGITAIFGFGIYSFGLTGSKSSVVSQPLHNWPLSTEDMTSYMGVAIFCFGVCSLVFPVEANMKKKNEINLAVLYCLLFVWSIYTVVGDGLALLYVHDARGIMSNILQNLPIQSTSAIAVRVSMAAVCLFTFPLTLVPPAQMIEQLIHHNLRGVLISSTSGKGLLSQTTSYTSIEASDNSNKASVNGDHNEESSGDMYSENIEEPPVLLRFSVRFVLISMCTLLAISIPCFGDVISLLGSFTVSILSFVMPPILHYQLVSSQLLTGYNRIHLEFKNDCISPRTQSFIDIIFFVLGVCICLFGTYINSVVVINKMNLKSC